MGTFTYGQAHEVLFDDRTLAHLRSVIVTKLRRNEPFLFTWTHDVNSIAKHHSVWLHPAVALSFDIEASATVSLNREWLDALATAANSGAGLFPHLEPPRRLAKCDSDSRGDPIRT